MYKNHSRNFHPQIQVFSTGSPLSVLHLVMQLYYMCTCILVDRQNIFWIFISVQWNNYNYPSQCNIFWVHPYWHGENFLVCFARFAVELTWSFCFYHQQNSNISRRYFSIQRNLAFLKKPNGSQLFPAISCAVLYSHYPDNENGKVSLKS